jgi:carbon-monoxide dehydrogenase iron sulfur subunit
MGNVVTTILQMNKLPESNVIQVDAAVCVGCKTCELVCSLQHEGVFSLALSRLSVARDPFAMVFVPVVCRQCRTPECVAACPVEGAMTVDEATGARLIVAEKCVGCGACAEACPWNAEYEVIKLHPEKQIYVKCDLCGGAPACVAFCPVGALTYVVKERE